jgi:hypothetical protein
MDLILVENRGYTGFFSNVDVILRAIISARSANIENIYVHWENENYGEAKENLFEKYISGPQKRPMDGAKVLHAIQLAQPMLYKDLSWQQHEILEQYGFFRSEFFEKIKAESVNVENVRLGVQVRDTIEHYETPGIAKIFKKLDEVREGLPEKYRRNFVLVTDKTAVISAFKARYDNDVVINSNIYRTPFFEVFNHYDWPKNCSKDKLVADVIRDAYILSLCDEVIYSGSNIATISAAFRPGNYYHFIDTVNQDAADGGANNIRKIKRQPRRSIL